MPARTTMLHIRVDEQLKAEATETLADLGLTVSDAVRILLPRVVRDKALPASLTAKGPLLYRPKSAHDDREALRPVGSFEVENDVVIEQGAYAIGGQKLKVRTRKGRPAIESLDLEGAVTVTAPEGVFAGGLVTWTQADGERARPLR